MNINQIPSAIFLCAAIPFSAPAHAETCNDINRIDQIVGEYEISNGPGRLINVPQIGIVPAAATATLTATMTKHGDALGLDSQVFGSLVVDFKVASDADEIWEFGDSDTFLSISSEDIALALECDPSNRLMRLIGTGTTELPNVGIRPVSMQLIVFPRGYIIGRMDVVMNPPNITLQTKIFMARAGD